MPAQVQHPAGVWAPASLRPTWLEIDLGAVAHNTRELRRLVGNDVAIYGCPKRNAYGCGAAAVGRTFGDVCRQIPEKRERAGAAGSRRNALQYAARAPRRRQMNRGDMMGRS